MRDRSKEMSHPLQVAIRTLAIGVLAATVVSGQTVLNDAKKIADAGKLFDTLRDDQSGCEVSPLKPHFIFSLRLQAGYVARLPLAHSGQKWVVLIRITAQEGNGIPVYLSDVAQFPGGGVSGQESKIEGSYWLGEGRYSATFLMFDSGGDVCRKDWQIDARLTSGVSEFKAILAPGTVGGSLGPNGGLALGAKPIDRLTILLHASSVLQRQTLLGPLDKAMLLDGMVALMEELPARSVRLVVFNLEQRRELLRKDGFTLEELPEVARILDALQPAAVDYSAVQNPGGTVHFVENLLNQEMHASEPSEAVIFLGSKSIYKSKPSPSFGLAPGVKQRFFYLACEPTRFLLPRSSTLSEGDWGAQGLAMGLPTPSPPGGAIQPNAPDNPPNVPNDLVWKNYGPNAGADSIEYAVGQLKGKTLQVDSPVSFAEAVAKIVHLTGVNR
jgi:hypothetical protein